MTKFSALVIIIAARIFYHPAPEQSLPAAFSHPSVVSATAEFAQARVVSVSANLYNDKVYVNWAVSENETADMFEVEKSVDGRNFKMAALVFGTDKPEKDNYQFYEKAGNRKLVYRIKLINKDKKTEYSSVVEISPAA